jgi:hypothetical protein
MGVIRGLDCTCYYNTGTFGAPIWNLLDDIHNLDLKDSKTKGDASRRKSPVKQEVNTQRVVEITFDLVRDPEDDGFAAIQEAYDEDDLIEFAFADGPIATPGTKYTRFECQINDFSPTEPLDGVSMYSCSASPTYTDNEQGVLAEVP